jgi:hypothetical protein
MMMRASNLAGWAMIAASATLALGALMVAREAQPRRALVVNHLGAVASCVAEVQQTVSCGCVRGELRHFCERARWQAMRACRDGRPAAVANRGVFAPQLTVWCAPRAAAEAGATI